MSPQRKSRLTPTFIPATDDEVTLLLIIHLCIHWSTNLSIHSIYFIQAIIKTFILVSHIFIWFYLYYFLICSLFIEWWTYVSAKKKYTHAHRWGDTSLIIHICICWFINSFIMLHSCHHQNIHALATVIFFIYVLFHPRKMLLHKEGKRVAIIILR